MDNDGFDLTTWLQLLRAALERLSAPADRQVAYLGNRGLTPLADELALEFDDAYVPLAPTTGRNAGLL